MNYLIPRFKQDFPTRAIVTLGYRLGKFLNKSCHKPLTQNFSNFFMNPIPATIASPGFPKQVEDIRLALEYLRSTFTNDVTISLMGDSAGSHLCMLYAYSSQDPSVEAVVSKVGPADFSDPVYTDNPIYTVVLYNLVGQCDFADCPDTWLAASPVTHINSGSPPTIGFYGDVDIVVPTNQMPTLRDRLELFGVKSNFTVYHGGHVGWPDEHIDDMMSRVKVFFDEVESRE